MDNTQISFREWIRQYEESSGKFGDLADLLRDYDYLEYPDDSNFWHWYSFILHNFDGLSGTKALFALRQIWGVYDMRTAPVNNEPFSIGSCVVAHFPENIDVGVLKLPFYAKVYINDVTDDGVEFIRTEPDTTYSFIVPYDQCINVEVAELANDHFADEFYWNELRENSLSGENQ